jgi:hypothetical protein
LPIEQLGLSGRPGSLARANTIDPAHEGHREKLGLAAHEPSGRPALPARLGMFVRSWNKAEQSG